MAGVKVFTNIDTYEIEDVDDRTLLPGGELELHNFDGDTVALFSNWNAALWDKEV